MNKISPKIRCFVYVWILMLSACSFAPKFEIPSVPVPEDYKEVGPWVETKTDLDSLRAGKAWWEIFQDPILNSLESRLECDNNHLKTALAKFDEARACAQVTASALYPRLDAYATVSRHKDSLNQDPIAPIDPNTATLINNTFFLTSILTYEIDAWGRVRNSVIASDSIAQASCFDLATIRLSLQAELASDYFQLRAYDKMQCILDKTVHAYQKSLYLIRQQHQGGLVPRGDEDAAISQLENSKTASEENHLKRERMEHAIAVLLGDAPANFDIEPANIPIYLATLCPDLPSTLLMQRPDIAASIERVRAANAQIGVARAAFFPQFNFFGLIGYDSNRLSNLFTYPNLIWSLGPSPALSLIKPEIAQVIFDGYKLKSLLCKAKADYFETVSHYKQTVLDAFKEVEDSLSSIHRLDEANISQTKATRAAHDGLYQARQQYRGGLITYIDVVVYENNALQSELKLIDIKTRRQLSSVQLIKALGGGWMR